ncbi:GNAT family N-acetyltransferase [uncultured Erythrobacter sp.]|uniref:GNAT family N-acetyltransferase n=1 Tax=uncultured Erythrobacter sp. TaxID=263913 RepID=UPI00261DDDE8|nr:GNAT family N-acetyltransferase [uncultured Erythrobacter sp.]
MEIRATDLGEAEVLALLELHHSEMQQFSPPGTCHVLDLDGLKQPGIEVFAAWDEGRLLAIGALKQHDGFGEIKSMRAHPDARGTGAGKAMLEHLIARGRELGLAQIKLETGRGTLFEAAVGLYKARGFEPCGSFAGYVPGDFTQLFALDIA